MSIHPEREAHQSAHHYGSASVTRRSSGSHPVPTSCPGELSVVLLFSWNNTKQPKCLNTMGVGFKSRATVFCARLWILLNDISHNNPLEKNFRIPVLVFFLPSAFQGAEAGLLSCIDALSAGRVLWGMEWVAGVAGVSSRWQGRAVT